MMHKLNLWDVYGVKMKQEKTTQEDLNKELIKACENNEEFNTVKDLVGQGADVNAINKYDITSLHFACEKNNLEIVKFLVEKGADINAKTNYCSTPLHWACNENNLEIVKFLIEKGADINVKTNYCSTPLHWACNENNLEIVKFLVEKGADINAIDKDGDTPLDVAKKYNHQKIVQYLESLEDLKKEEITKEKQYNQETTMNSYLSDNINNSVELINKAKENIFLKIDELTKTVQLLDEAINKLDKN